LDWRAFAKGDGTPSIGIVGGGVAGLTAAYRLQAVGAKPVPFEASNRRGGRMLTIYDFHKGMFCELGGEFVERPSSGPHIPYAGQLLRRVRWAIHHAVAFHMAPKPVL
jgi:monoamine oxidase